MFGRLEVMMANQRCGEEDAEAILSNLKMEGRFMAADRGVPMIRGGQLGENPTRTSTACGSGVKEI